MATFTDGLDSSLQAVTGIGVQLYVGSGSDYTATTWSLVEGMKSGSFPSPDKPKIDVSDCKNGRKAKSYIPGLGETPDVTYELHNFNNNSVHQRIVSDLAMSGEVVPWKLEGNGKVWMFMGYVKSAAVSYSFDAAESLPLVITISDFGTGTVYVAGAKGAISWDNDFEGDKAAKTVAGQMLATIVPAQGSTITFNTAVTNGTAMSAGTHYSISGVPSGLTAVVTKTSGTVATVTLTGTSTSDKDVTSAKITFLNAAFSNAVASEVNSVAYQFAITFS